MCGFTGWRAEVAVYTAFGHTYFTGGGGGFAGKEKKRFNFFAVAVYF